MKKSNDNDVFALAVLRLKQGKNKQEKLDFITEVLPYVAEHKNELQSDIDSANRFRQSIVKEEIKKKIIEIQKMVDNL